MNPYMKDSELKPCTFCKLTKKANNNISSMIDDEENKVKNNKNNLTQKQMFGKVPSKGKVPKGKVPKGSHRMPDGSIMKDKDMPKKKTKGKKKSIY